MKRATASLDFALFAWTVFIGPLFAGALARAADAPQRPRITGVAHIALFVHDMEKARWFYKDFLGFGEPYSLNKPEGGLSMTFIKVNDRQYIELFPEVEPGDRLNHISVETDNVEAMRLYLASKGIKVPEKVNLGRIKNLSFTIKDPDGHGVEFVQYMPEGWSMREKGKYMPAERVFARMMHVGILVGDLDKAMKFYRDILGFQEFWRGSRDGKVLNWVNMRVPDGDTYVEFMLYDQIPAPTARGTAHHICLEVPDIAKTKTWLEARAAAKDYGKPLEIRTGTNRKRQMNLYDPDGTRAEVMEPVTMDGVPAPSATAPPPHSAAARPAMQCSEIASASFGTDVKINSAGTVVAKGATPEHCDVRGTVFPEARFAVWLPADWNGRFTMVGNGGTAGVISFGAMDQNLRKGYAVASTDTGHDAAKEPLATFAEHRPDNPNADRKFTDFAYQAVHETAVLGKKIVQTYYGEAPRYSYWVGCSTGGRQGLVEAQRFPEDFDGLVTGAPALDHTGNNMRVLWNAQAQIGPGEIPVAKMPLLAEAVYKKCDGVDGLKDGIIDDPRRCDFDPMRDLPRCPGLEGANCFTAAQAEALKKIYGGVRNSAGKLLFPGMPVGAEALVKSKSGWEGNIVGPNLLPLARSESYMKFMFLEPRPGPDWTWRAFNFDSDPARMAKGAAMDNAANPDMRPLQQRGGKIIQYHGWADQQITALSSVNYYESVLEHMGVKETKEFYRLFMVPGMFHCSGGVGCGSVDWLAPLVDWVEKGKAPDMLIGAHLEGTQITRTRPLCAYPEVAKYKGSGSIDEATNFTCVRAD